MLKSAPTTALFIKGSRKDREHIYRVGQVKIVRWKFYSTADRTA